MRVGLLPQIRRFISPSDVSLVAHLARVAEKALPNIASKLLRDRDRWPLWLPVALGSGIGIYFELPFEPPLAWAAAAGVAGTAFLLWVIASDGSALRICLSLLAAVSFGFAIAKARTEIVAAPVLSSRIGPVGLDGLVEQSELHGKGIRIVLGRLHIRQLSSRETPARVRISVRAETALPQPGRRVRVTAVLMPPPAPASPGAYDFGRTAYYLRIGGVGYAYGHLSDVGADHDDTQYQGVSLFVEQLRARITERIHSVLPGSTGGIASALITGNRSAISEDDEQALRDAGLAHVLAIAGLHMALVGLGLFWIVRAALAAIPTLALRYPIKKIAAVAALCSAVFYLAISGATSASTRAFVMLALMLISILFDRPALSMRSLALAASIILVLGPESLLEPGFQMSFAAVMSLIAVAEWEATREKYGTPPGSPIVMHVRRYLRGITVTSLVGSLATIPFAIFHFNRATHYAVLGNLFAMPIMGFVVMPGAALSILLMPFGLDAWPLHVTAWGIKFMVGVGRWVSGLPGSVSVMPAWPMGALVLVSFGGLWIGLWRQRWRWYGALPLIVGVALAYWSRPPDILVGRDGTTVALRVPDGSLKLVKPAKDVYAADEWLKRDGDANSSDEAVASDTDGVACDAFGCIATASGGMIVANVFRTEALAEDCNNAMVVISSVRVRSACTHPKLVVDSRDILRSNGISIWLQPALRWQSVEQARGLRPWSEQVRAKGIQYRRRRPTSLP